MDAVCATGQHVDATRAYLTDEGHELILPLARRRALRPMMVASSMPFGWGTGGLLSSRGSLTDGEVAAVVRDLVSQDALFIGVRPNPLRARPWATAVPNGTVRTAHMFQSIDLTVGFDAIWNRRLPATVRSHCRKAERRGITIECDDTGRLIPVFDYLYRRSVARWASQQHEPLWLAEWRANRRDPPEKFRSVARGFGPACRVWMAWKGDRPVASMIALCQGHQCIMWRAAMDKDAIKGTGANELLNARAIEQACDEGHRFFHLGESAPSSSLAHNKAKFGADELHYTGFRFERLPLTAADQLLRRQVKWVIGFRD